MMAITLTIVRRIINGLPSRVYVVFNSKLCQSGICNIITVKIIINKVVIFYFLYLLFVIVFSNGLLKASINKKIQDQKLIVLLFLIWTLYAFLPCI
jgi:hypothetical protein